MRNDLEQYLEHFNGSGAVAVQVETSGPDSHTDGITAVKLFAGGLPVLMVGSDAPALLRISNIGGFIWSRRNGRAFMKLIWWRVERRWRRNQD